MATIRTAIQIQDRMTPAFQSMNNALNIVLNTFESVQNISGRSIDTASIQTARNEIASANVILQQVENEIRNVESAQESFNNEVGNTSTQFNIAQGSAGSFFNTLMGFSAIQKIFNVITDQVGSAIDRLDTLNNFPKVMSNLGVSEEQANASMQVLSEGLKGLPTTLNDAVSSVQNFTSVNGSVGKSTQMFLALNNAILAGGGSTQVQQSALEQLSQAYAKGKPDMMEWRTAMTAMPAQLRQVAKAMGYVDANALGENLRTGKASMTDFMNTFIELNETGANGFQSFEEQARNATGGFATSIANMKSAVTRGIASMITSINTALESAGLPSIQEIIVQIGTNLENMLTNIGYFVQNVITYLEPVISFVQWLGAVITDNWSIISPILYGILAMLGVYLVYVTLVKVATMAWSAVQAILNAILYANPIVLIILAIIAVISLIYAVVAAINKVTGKTTSATGIIMGVIYTLGAFIYNNFIVPTWNSLTDLVNFLANCFKDPVTAIKILFIDMSIAILEKIKSVMEGVEKMVNSVSWATGYTMHVAEDIKTSVEVLGLAKDELKEKMKWEDIMEHIDTWDYQDAWDAGYKKGEEIDEAIGNFFNPADIIKNAKIPLDTTAIEPVGNDVGNIAGNTGSIKDSLECTEEDLRYLRDLAEQETINRFTTAEIKIDMTNNNNISSDTDIDGIVEYLEEELQQTMESIAEGVYV